MWTALTFMPLSLAPLLLLGLAFLWMLGIIRGGQVVAIMAFVLILVPLLGALLPPVLDQLPMEIFLIVVLAVSIIVIRWCLTVLIGKEGASNFLGRMLFEFVMGVFRLPFSLLGWLLAMPRRGR